MSSTDELQKLIEQIKLRVERTRQKIVTANTTDDSNVEVSITRRF